MSYREATKVFDSKNKRLHWHGSCLHRSKGRHVPSCHNLQDRCLSEKQTFHLRLRVRGRIKTEIKFNHQNIRNGHISAEYSADLACSYFSATNVFCPLRFVATYLSIFNWVWNDMRVGFRTLLRALLSSFVILLVTTHSDEQLGQRGFLIRRYIRVIWFTRDTRLRRIWPTRKQNRRTSILTLSLRSHTSKWRPEFPACRSILIAKDYGHRYWQGIFGVK